MGGDDGGRDRDDDGGGIGIGDSDGHLGQVVVLASTVGRFGLTEQTEVRLVDNVKYQILPERMTSDVPPTRHWSAPPRSGHCLYN
jgi:hypothetical protein